MGGHTQSTESQQLSGSTPSTATQQRPQFGGHSPQSSDTQQYSLLGWDTQPVTTPQFQPTGGHAQYHDVQKLRETQKQAPQLHGGMKKVFLEIQPSSNQTSGYAQDTPRVVQSQHYATLGDHAEPLDTNQNNFKVSIQSHAQPLELHSHPHPQQVFHQVEQVQESADQLQQQCAASVQIQPDRASSAQVLQQETSAACSFQSQPLTHTAVAEQPRQIYPPRTMKNRLHYFQTHGSAKDKGSPHGHIDQHNESSDTELFQRPEPDISAELYPAKDSFQVEQQQLLFPPLPAAEQNPSVDTQAFSSESPFSQSDTSHSYQGKSDCNISDTSDALASSSYGSDLSRTPSAQDFDDVRRQNRQQLVQTQPGSQPRQKRQRYEMTLDQSHTQPQYYDTNFHKQQQYVSKALIDRTSYQQQDTATSDGGTYQSYCEFKPDARLEEKEGLENYRSSAGSSASSPIFIRTAASAVSSKSCELGSVSDSRSLDVSGDSLHNLPATSGRSITTDKQRQFAEREDNQSLFVDYGHVSNRQKQNDYEVENEAFVENRQTGKERQRKRQKRPEKTNATSSEPNCYKSTYSFVPSQSSDSATESDFLTAKTIFDPESRTFRSFVGHSFLNTGNTQNRGNLLESREDLRPRLSRGPSYASMRSHQSSSPVFREHSQSKNMPNRDYNSSSPVFWCPESVDRKRSSAVIWYPGGQSVEDEHLKTGSVYTDQDQPTSRENVSSSLSWYQDSETGQNHLIDNRDHLTASSSPLFWHPPHSEDPTQTSEAAHPSEAHQSRTVIQLSSKDLAKRAANFSSDVGNSNSDVLRDVLTPHGRQTTGQGQNTDSVYENTASQRNAGPVHHSGRSRTSNVISLYDNAGNRTSNVLSVHDSVTETRNSEENVQDSCATIYDNVNEDKSGSPYDNTTDDLDIQLVYPDDQY